MPPVTDCVCRLVLMGVNLVALVDVNLVVQDAKEVVKRDVQLSVPRHAVEIAKELVGQSVALIAYRFVQVRVTPRVERAVSSHVRVNAIVDVLVVVLMGVSEIVMAIAREHARGAVPLRALAAAQVALFSQHIESDE